MSHLWRMRCAKWLDYMSFFDNHQKTPALIFFRFFLPIRRPPLQNISPESSLHVYRCHYFRVVGGYQFFAGLARAQLSRRVDFHQWDCSRPWLLPLPECFVALPAPRSQSSRRKLRAAHITEVCSLGRLRNGSALGSPPRLHSKWPRPLLF